MIKRSGVKRERLETNRREGKQTEKRFCRLLQRHDCFTYRFQKGYPKAAVLQGADEYVILPDVWIVPMSYKNQCFAEVKGKYPSKYETYGLEKYRVDSLLRISDLTGVRILYAIYDTRDKKWYWNDLHRLMKKPYKEYWSRTYVNGQVKMLPTYYFLKKWFINVEENGVLNFP